jgi:hypothetical protein
LAAVLPLLVAAATGLACGGRGHVDEPRPETVLAAPTSGMRLNAMIVDGVRVLAHPTLGFYLTHPGQQFVWSQEVEARICTSMETELSVECHALWDSSTGTIFTVQLNTVPSAAHEDFPDFHRGLVGGLGEEMTIAHQAIEIDAEGRPISRILALGTGDGVSVFAQTHPLIDGVSGRHYAVSVFVYGSDAQAISALGITYHGP